MAFPDSLKKSPNVFFEFYDDTVGAVTSSSVAPRRKIQVISPPPPPPPPPPGPVADFFGIPVLGDVPLTVNFTDLSI